jgi:hypothetical protein
MMQKETLGRLRAAMEAMEAAGGKLDLDPSTVPARVRAPPASAESPNIMPQPKPPGPTPYSVTGSVALGSSSNGAIPAKQWLNAARRTAKVQPKGIVGISKPPYGARAHRIMPTLTVQTENSPLPSPAGSQSTPSFASIVKLATKPTSPLNDSDQIFSPTLKKMAKKAKDAKSRVKKRNLEKGPIAKSLSLFARCSNGNIYFQLLNASWPITLLWAFCFYGIIVLFCALLLCAISEFDAGTIASDEIMEDHGFSDFGAFVMFCTCNVMVLNYGPFMPVELPVLIFATAMQVAGVIINVFLFSIIVTKYQRPTAALIFSEHAIFTRRHGVPFFLFRIANRRCNLLYHPTFAVTLVEHVYTPEGESFMRPLPLELDSEIAVVSGCVTIAHKITRGTPLWKYVAISEDGSDQANVIREHLLPQDFYISITAQAHDSVYRSDIMASKRYLRAGLRFNVRYADVMEMDPVSHKLQLNFKKFDETVPIKIGTELAESPEKRRSVAEFCF